MQLRPEQLAKHLTQTLAPVYLISGGEPLLAQECADALRAACRQQNFSERQVFHVDNGFDWQQLVAETSALSLFAERKLIELRLPSGKPGDAGSQALDHYCKHISTDTVLMILCEKLESSATRSKWYKAVDAAGVTITVWPVAPAQLPRWIEQRLRSRGLSASTDAVQLLAERVQGNLLAAAQEIEKLQLYAGDHPIDVETIANTVADSARFDTFGMAEQALSGQAAPALRALNGLRGEGVEPPMILWVLVKELRTLYRCAEQIEQGSSIDRAMDGAGVWDRRKPLIKQALQRLPLRLLAELLQLAQRTDAAVKGGNADDPWQLLDRLVVGLSRR
jgi:DNA polymerase-3 subunit delta